jgi:hypothetical protein
LRDIFKDLSVKKIFVIILFSLLSFFCNKSHSQDTPTLVIPDSMAHEGPDTVKIGAYIINLHNFNYHEKEFSMRFWLWTLYKHPEFDFRTQIEVPNAKEIEKSDIIIDSVDNMLWLQMKMKCVMRHNWSVRDFPFDDQILKLHVENTIFNSDDLIFVPDTASSTYSSTLDLDGWNVTDFQIKSGVTEYNTAFGDPHAEKQYSKYGNFEIWMKIERDALGLFLKLFVGMFIAFMISSVSFFVKPDQVDPRFGLSVGGLFAAVGNKYIIDSSLPETSQFTLVDTLHSVTFVAIFITIVISAICLGVYNQGKPQKADKINRITSRITIGSYVLICMTFVLMAIFH